MDRNKLIVVTQQIYIDGIMPKDLLRKLFEYSAISIEQTWCLYLRWFEGDPDALSVQKNEIRSSETENGTDEFWNVYGS